MAASEKPDRQDRLVERLISEHHFAINAYLRSILPGIRDVEDILQEVLIVLWRKRAQFQENTNFKAWAFSIARFQGMSAQGKYKRSSWLVFDDEMLDFVTVEFEAAEEYLDPRKVALTDCLSKIRKDDLNLLRHRYISKKTLEEHAEAVNRSVVALRVRLHKLRIQLRRCIENNLKAHPEE